MNWKFWKQPSSILHPPSSRPQLVLRPLSEAELRAGFRAAPDAPLWASTLAELDEFIIEVSDRPLAEDLSDAAVRFHVGGQAALVEFKARLLKREEQARQHREEETPENHE